MKPKHFCSIGRFFALLYVLVFSSCQKIEEKLVIAAAANMQFTIHELVDKFTNQTGVKCDIVLGSSGRITSQIKEGAPYDVFISADMKYPRKLEELNLTLSKTTKYASGILVLWTLTEKQPLIDLLTSSRIKKISIANPKIAPYGIAAIEVLKHFKIFDMVDAKLVYGESISQANQFISTGAAEIGFTSKSTVLSSKLENTGYWKEIDHKLHAPISQGIVILKGTERKIAKAGKFKDFLFSTDGQEILNKFGYLTP